MMYLISICFSCHIQTFQFKSSSAKVYFKFNVNEKLFQILQKI